MLDNLKADSSDTLLSCLNGIKLEHITGKLKA